MANLFVALIDRQFDPAIDSLVLSKKSDVCKEELIYYARKYDTSLDPFGCIPVLLKIGLDRLCEFYIAGVIREGFSASAQDVDIGRLNRLLVSHSDYCMIE
jgi:hypothetical protein